MSTANHIPATVDAKLGARLAPFCGTPRSTLEDLDVEAAGAVAPHGERPARLGLFSDLKLLFAALAAGGSAVPLGDNGRTAHLLAQYAASLRDH
jgi:hypothetical protein